MHFYRTANYGDLRPEDFDASLHRYGRTADLVRQLRRLKPDIVQGVEPFSLRLLPRLYAIFALACARGIPLVCPTLENRPLDVKHGRSRARLLRALLRPVFGYASLIIPVNQGARRNVLSVGPFGGKCRLMMYGTWGVDLDDYTPVPDGREPEVPGRPTLLYAGRLHPEKGIDDLLVAFKMVHAEVPGASLWLAGNGPLRQTIDRWISEQRLGSSIKLLGTLKNQDLPPYFRAADLVVSPSVTTKKWEEQVGMTNLQAMACGVPVVSTISGAIPEYVPASSGVLVPEHDPRALASAIIDLSRDSERRRMMGEAGAAHAREHYDSQRNIAEIEGTILDCCGVADDLQ